MKPDVIVVHPQNKDYPQWRKFIVDNRCMFNEIIIAFTPTFEGFDYRKFIMRELSTKYVQFVNSVCSPADWRDSATKSALQHSYNAPWIWFMEQDFFILDEEAFWEEVYGLERAGCDAIGVYDGTRLHPACMFIKRKVLESIDMDFSAKPPEYDHFGKIQQQLEDKSYKIGVLSSVNYNHMAGLTHNISLIERRQEPNYKIHELKHYLRESLEIGVELHPHYVKMVENYLGV